MPYKSEHVPAELFLKHLDVEIYHIYEDNDIEQGPKDFYFGFTEDCSEGGDFDVREIEGWTECPHPPFVVGENDTPANHQAWEIWHNDEVQKHYIKAFIMQAIEKGIIKMPEAEQE